MCYSDYKGICASPRLGAIEHAQDEITEASIEYVVAFDEGLIGGARLVESISEEIAYQCDRAEEHDLTPDDICSVEDVLRWVRQDKRGVRASIVKSVGAS